MENRNKIIVADYKNGELLTDIASKHRLSCTRVRVILNRSLERENQSTMCKLLGIRYYNALKRNGINPDCIDDIKKIKISGCYKGLGQSSIYEILNIVNSLEAC